MLRSNPRVVFFREEPLPDPGVGPKGAQGVPLSPGRSIAVDPQSVPYGTPVWLDTTEPLATRPLRRLVVAQDTGSAIIGAVRADYFWGWGDDAEAAGGPDEAAAADVGAVASVVTSGAQARRPIDGGRAIDWSRTSADYASHRPGPPARLYDLLAALGVGGSRPAPARPRHRHRPRRARARAPRRRRQRHRRRRRPDRRRPREGACGRARGRLRRRRRRGVPFADASFDAVVASQCWMYFDVERTLAEVRRVLRPKGVLVTTHFSWLPRADPIARASEALVLGLNPAWQGADWPGRIATEPAWAAGRASVRRCSGSTPTCRSRVPAGAAGCAPAAASARRCPTPTSPRSTPRSTPGSRRTRRRPSPCAIASMPTVHAVAGGAASAAGARVERFFRPQRLIAIDSRRLPS